MMNAPDLSEREQQVALAAMRYFLKEDDAVRDTYMAGHVDDALVVQAAMNELQARLG
jgi:hypothetical protein